MPQDLFALTGKVALITGSSQGLGWEMAKALAEAGAVAVLNGRDEERLSAGVAELERLGLRAEAAAFDVLDEVQARAAVDRIAERHGRLDVLVSNAGVQHRSTLAEWQMADWRRVLATNLDACFVLAQAAARHMARAGAGRIIFTTSMVALLARPTIAAYVAAKAGLAGLTRALAAELGPQGINCNAIAPGYFETEMNEALIANAAFHKWVVGRVPLARWGRPRELAGAVVFLASEAGSYVNGHQLVVDGGASSVL